MLKSLPIIPSRTSQIFDPLFLFYAHIITYYSYLFLIILVNLLYYIGDNNVHSDYYTGEYIDY